MPRTSTAAKKAAQDLGSLVIRQLSGTLSDLVLDPNADVPEEYLSQFRATLTAAEALIKGERSVGVNYAMNDANLTESWESAQHALHVLQLMHGPQEAVSV